MVNKEPVVMIVDDNPHNLQYLGELIEKNGYDYVMATDGKMAWEFLENEHPDIILLDVMMPELDGFELCKRIKAHPELHDIPVIFITAKAEPEEIVSGFAVGGVDYVTKPFNSVVLEARVRSHIELKRSRDEMKSYISLLQEANETISEKNKQLEVAFERAEYFARRDYLTGLVNRRHMMERLEQEVTRFRRSGKTFSLAILDIDNFKKFNDRFGHDCGDYVLVSVSRMMEELFREQDTVARWGGEEFLILWPETDFEGGTRVAEKLRSMVDCTPFMYDGQQLSIQISVGVAVMHPDESLDECINRADRCLLKAKASGKNRVAGENELGPEGVSL